ncbi:hypothetical protein [Flavobacterium sp.]|uniref:hypothetical protein n=1 Tax=Flavobacterium sp. TaxID=239 RepID=UPI003D6A825B
MKVINATPSFKLVAICLVVALVSCLGYSFKVYQNAKNTKRVLNNEKNMVINELRKSKDSLELAISENSTLKSDLIIERQKVTNLLDEISSSNVDLASIIKYKNEVSRLKDVIASLTKDKQQLKLSNDLLKIQRDSTILVLSSAKRYNDTLLAMNEDLNRVIKRGSKISVINLKTITGKQSKSGDLTPTDKANKVNLLQISFMVVGNKIVRPCSKEYYVQIIDSKNNIVGDRKTIKFGPMILDYSFESPVRFKNESLEVTADLELTEAEKGTYYVNIFDKSELASKTTFALR